MDLILTFIMIITTLLNDERCTEEHNCESCCVPHSFGPLLIDMFSQFAALTRMEHQDLVPHVQ